MERDPASGNALQEISFWLNLEKALHRIEDKQESPEVKLTLDILKFAKRFHAIVSFTNDTGKCFINTKFIFRFCILYELNFKKNANHITADTSLLIFAKYLNFFSLSHFKTERQF